MEIILALFECIFIVRQDVTQSQVESLKNQFELVLKENGGKVVNFEHWGLRNLAYKIKKNKKGHYVLLNIDSPASALHEMERQMRISEDVLRYLTISVNKHKEGPSIIMQSKNRDDDSSQNQAVTEDIATPLSTVSEDFSNSQKSTKEIDAPTNQDQAETPSTSSNLQEQT